MLSTVETEIPTLIEIITHIFLFQLIDALTACRLDIVETETPTFIEIIA